MNTYIICKRRLFSVSPVRIQAVIFERLTLKLTLKASFDLFSCNLFIIKLTIFSIAPFSLTSGHLKNTASGSRETKSTAVEQLRLEIFNR